ncbi:MAG: hypothetical protein MZW92_49050 [Comamonadaceae bacterium]|nr:hypothetical protein [Comamonadaceae bacterium]
MTLIASSMPVWMLAVGALVLRRAPDAPRSSLGAALSPGRRAGRASARGALQTLLATCSFVAGDLFMLAAVIGWAVYSWLLARPPAAHARRRAPGLGLGRASCSCRCCSACSPRAVLQRRRASLAGAAPIRWSAAACWPRCCTSSLGAVGRSPTAAGAWAWPQVGPALAGLLQQPHAAVRRAAVGAGCWASAPQPTTRWRSR